MIKNFVNRTFQSEKKTRAIYFRVFRRRGHVNNFFHQILYNVYMLPAPCSPRSHTETYTPGLLQKGKKMS